MDDDNRLIWLDGRILPLREARECVLSPSFQFGLNVFEGIPGYWNKERECIYAFRLFDHYERLLQSAMLLQIECSYTKDEMRAALDEIVSSCGYRENISVRQTLFVKGHGSWASEGPVGMFIAPIRRKDTSSEYNKMGLKACIASWKRINESMISPRIKCGANYINSRMGQREALRNGYDTCIFLNEIGKVAEGPGSCLFMVKKGILMTPLLTDSVLESITRDTVIIMAEEMGIDVCQCSIDRTELYSADEVFLCGSAMEIRPVVSVDGYKITDGYGEITRHLHDRYLQYAKGEVPDVHGWLEEIDPKV